MAGGGGDGSSVPNNSLYAEQAGPRVDGFEKVLGPDLRPVQPQATSPYADPAQAVQQAGGAAAMPTSTAAQTGSAVFGGSVATPTAGEAPGQQAPRRGRASWEAPGEAVQFTQEDFYPNPQDPFAGQYSTGVEYVARQGRMPMGALSKAAAALNDRQLQLDEKRQAFNDELYKPIKTATPYQQNFNAIVNKQREDFVKSVADAYTGGDVNKAYRQIFSSPQLRNQWRQINADLEALGQRGADIFAKAEKYLADAATNSIGSTPEMRKLARDIMYGMGGYASADGTGGDFNTLIKNIKQFEMMEGRDRYFRDTVTKSVKDFAERLPYTADGKKPYVITAENRYRFITQGHRETFINQIKQIARDMAVYQGYGEGADLTAMIADNEKFLMAMLPDRYDLKTTVEDTYANISRGGGDGGQKGPQYSITSAVRPNTLSPLTRETDELYFTPSETVGNRKQNVAAAPVRIVSSDPSKSPQTRVIGYPELKFDELAQDWVITGNDLGNIAETTVKTTSPETTDEADALTQQVDQLVAKSNKTIYALASDNPDFMNNKYETTDPYQILSNQLGGAISANDLRANFGSDSYRRDIKERLRTRTAPGASTPSASAAPAAVQQSGQETPPEPGAVWINGGWWKEVNGKVVQVK